MQHLRHDPHHDREQVGFPDIGQKLDQGQKQHDKGKECGYNKEGCLRRVHGDLILYAPVPDLFAVKEKRNHKKRFLSEVLLFIIVAWAQEYGKESRPASCRCWKIVL